MKPIEFDRFYKAVQKVEKLSQLNKVQKESRLNEFLFVKDGYKQVKLKIDEILFIRGEGNYLNIVSLNEKAFGRMTFQQLMKKLPEDIFIRIHNSYVINLCHIDKIEDNHVFINKTQIPIGIKFKDELMRRINR